MNGISSGGSSGSTSSLNNTSSLARITGLSGFDTETMIKQLMQAEKVPLNSLIQKKTLVQWKQDAYRDVTNTLNGFNSTFFDVVNPSTYILSANSVKPMKASTSNSQYLDVSASSAAQAGSHNIKVEQVATADTAISQGKISQEITGTVMNFNLSGWKMRVTLDGQSKDVVLDNYTPGNIASQLQTTLNNAFGGTKISVGYNSGQLTIGTTGGATKITVGDPVSPGGNALESLGFTPGESNQIQLNDTLGNIAARFNTPLTFSGGSVSFAINGKLLTASTSDTLSNVIDRINNTAEANVTVKYDELTDKISITSKQLGDGDNLTMSDIGGNFLEAIGMDMDQPVTQQGQDAKILIDDDQEVVRNTNKFTVNNITYNLKSQHPNGSDGDTVTVEQDVDTAYNNIKAFIDKYNGLLNTLNGKINEKYDRDYPPLTDDQKANMKDADITSWEKKAKTGLLQNDSIVGKIVNDMRTAMYEPVTGTSLSLSLIGITSNSYQDKGKLYIDENKLKEALRNNPDEVVKLLNGVDPDNPSYSRTATPAQRQSRYQNSGLFQRLSDIIEDNVSTIRDNSKPKGLKGILLEKAGIEGDMSYNNNLLNDELNDYDKKISDMQNSINAKEDRYYQQFSAMETYLTQMNQQSAWIAQQFGGSSS